MIDFDGRSVLVTGTNSGLGKFIHERIPTSIPLTRDNRDDILVGQKYDIIIHSAYNSLNVDFTDLNLKYVDDNLLLTSDLINLCDGCFVYVSSIDSVNKIESCLPSPYQLNRLPLPYEKLPRTLQHRMKPLVPSDPTTSKISQALQ